MLMLMHCCEMFIHYNYVHIIIGYEMILNHSIDHSH